MKNIARIFVTFLAAVCVMGIAACQDETQVEIFLYSVTFDADGGAWGTESTKTVSVLMTQTVTPPSTNPTHSDSSLIYMRWSEVKGGVTPFDFTTKIVKDTTLYAVWLTPVPADSVEIDITGGIPTTVEPGTSYHLTVEVIVNGDTDPQYQDVQWNIAELTYTDLIDTGYGTTADLTSRFITGNTLRFDEKIWVEKLTITATAMCDPDGRRSDPIELTTIVWPFVQLEPSVVTTLNDDDNTKPTAEFGQTVLPDGTVAYFATDSKRQYIHANQACFHLWGFNQPLNGSLRLTIDIAFKETASVINSATFIGGTHWLTGSGSLPRDTLWYSVNNWSGTPNYEFFTITAGSHADTPWSLYSNSNGTLTSFAIWFQDSGSPVTTDGTVFFRNARIYF